MLEVIIREECRPDTQSVCFLNMFAGLETLILDFKRREGLEFVLPKPVWGVFKKYLENCVKKSTEPKLERKQRASIYQKIDELNRVSLREAFDAFCEKYSIDITDLWPVFEEKGVTGLSDIRNKLIHGDPFPTDLFGGLSVANEHLEYTLERVILRVLGWDVGKTNISPAYLVANLCAIKELPSAQLQLSRYIHDQEPIEAMAFRETGEGLTASFCGETIGQQEAPESNDNQGEK